MVNNGPTFMWVLINILALLFLVGFSILIFLLGVKALKALDIYIKKNSDQ